MSLAPRRAYYLVTTLHWFGLVMPMAVTVLLAQSRGITLTEVGLFMGLYSMVVAVLELPSGALADALGRKRAFLLGGALSIVARGIFLVAFDLGAFIAFAVVLGASRALTSGSLEAWFIDALLAEDPETDLQPELAAAGSFQLAGLAGGTLLGSALPPLFTSLPADATVSPLAVPLVTSLVVQALVLALAASVIHEARVGATATDVRGAVRPSAIVNLIARAVSSVAGAPRLRLLLFVDFVVGAVLAASENLWQPYFAGLLPGDDVTSGDGTVLLGVIIGGSFGVGVLGNLLATRLARLMGKRHALVAAIFQVAQGLAFMLLALSGRFLLAAAVFWLTYLTRSGWNSPHAALFHRDVPTHRRSVMLSAQSLAGFAGAFVGSVALGALADASSIDAAWLVAGAVLLLSAVPYLRLDGLDRRARVAQA